MFEAVLGQVEDSRLVDLIDRTRARLDEQPAPDVVGCSIASMRQVERFPRRSETFSDDPARHVLWMIEHLVARAAPTQVRMKAARAVVAGAPDLSMRLELLYRFRIPTGAPSKKPQLDLLESATFTQQRSELVSDAQNTDAPALSAERHLLWILQTIAEVRGPDDALVRLGEEPVLRALLEGGGTVSAPLRLAASPCISRPWSSWLAQALLRRFGSSPRAKSWVMTCGLHSERPCVNSR